MVVALANAILQSYVAMIAVGMVMTAKLATRVVEWKVEWPPLREERFGVVSCLRQKD